MGKRSYVLALVALVVSLVTLSVGLYKLRRLLEIREERHCRFLEKFSNCLDKIRASE